MKPLVSQDGASVYFKAYDDPTANGLLRAPRR